MEKRLTRLLLILALAALPTGTPFPAFNVLAQEKKPTAPTFFKVYSRDGRESLTALCHPLDRDPAVDQVTCKFINVRFLPPDKRSGKTEFPLSVEEAVKVVPGLEEEVRKNPKKVEQDMRAGLEQAKQEACSPKGRGGIEANMREPNIGPKRRAFYQHLLAACTDKDPTALFRRLRDIERRTCGLWVAQFTLEFRKVREGQWLHQQDSPGLLSKVVKVYELTADGLLWTLAETRVPTQGAEEKPTRTVWSWKNAAEYELPCEFIAHDLVQVP